MTVGQKQKSAPKSSPNLNDIDPAFLEVYNTKVCKKCGKPVSKARIEDCKARRFFPVCKKCEKEILPILKEAHEKLAKIQKGF